MVDPAPGSPANSPATGGDELTIPKHRFDEVNNELRRLREEVSVKDRLYLQDRERTLSERRAPAADITPEESGLDPAVHQAAVKIASKVAERIVAERSQVYEQQIGILAGRTEKAELLASKGSDKAKYLPDIQMRQQEHYRQTGSFLPAETALEMILSKEKDAEITRLKAALEAKATPGAATTGAPATAATTTPAQTGAPPASGTRQMPGGGNAGGAPSPSPAGTAFSDLKLEEMEARLEQQFSEGQRL